MSFIQDALRTESDKFFPVDRNDLHMDIDKAINAVLTLDGFKKAMFYGKNIEVYEPWDETIPVLDLSQDRRKARLLHAAIGMMTEAAEVLELVMEHVFEGVDLERAKVIEEHGDLKWYEAIMADELQYDFDEAQRLVINKLKLRFPEKFDSDLAINRDVKTEQEVYGSF